MTEQSKCGFVSVIGIPNAGKSTLINAMVGTKVSIVSRKIQTTRSRILGIALHDNTQIVLIDTPGIFKPKKTLEKAMVTAALSSIDECEYIMHIVDATSRNAIDKNKIILQSLEKHDNVILILNKIDWMDPHDLPALAREMNEAHPYIATFMISALNEKGVKDVTQYLADHLPKGEWIYPEDHITDMPMRLMASEITREKIFDQVHQEIPYSVFVETESWEEFDNGSIKISQVIYVQKDSQKGILLGKGGSKIKTIGQSSRIELEEIMERRVHLSLFVRVQENWAERAENYEIFGLDLPRG